MRQAQKIKISEKDRLRLHWIIERQSLPEKVIERVKIILLAERGISNIEIAEKLNTTRQKVARWRTRFLEHGLEGIEKDASRPGGKAELSDEVVENVIKVTTERLPKNGDFWTQKDVAYECGVSISSVSRIWKKYGINPRRNID